jgi:putative hemolysin
MPSPPRRSSSSASSTRRSSCRTARLFKRPDGSYLVDGAWEADSLKDALGIKELPCAEEEGYNTVAGLMIANFRALPAEGDYFDCEGWRFEVLDMDGQRVDKVLVSRIAHEDEETDASGI